MQSEPYFIRSSRLGFRWWTADKLPLAGKLWGDKEVTKLISADGFTDEQIEERLKLEISNAINFQVQYWPIYMISDDAFVGCCGLRPYKGTEPDGTSGKSVFELGFHLLPGCWGQGLAFEAATTAVSYAFDSLAAKALFAGHHPDNTASRHLLNKLGFIQESEMYYAPTGLMHPAYFLRRNG